MQFCLVALSLSLPLLVGIFFGFLVVVLDSYV